MNGLTLTTYQGDAPQAPAAELFGEAAGQPRTPGAMQIVIAGINPDTSAWQAGVLLEMEDVSDPQGEAELVASIRLLVVTPAVRGRGVAGRLLRRAMEVAREHGCVRLRSTAGFGCPDHLSMYYRLRFEDADAWERPYLVTRAMA